MKVSVAIARFPYGEMEHSACVDWLMLTYHKMMIDERISDVKIGRKSDTPITMTRNGMVQDCLNAKVDLLVMVDSDMGPDDCLAEPGSKPFWDSSFNYWWRYRKQKPCCIFAPYCGRPPAEVPMIFRWCTWEGDHPNPDWRMEMYSREEAATRTGFEKVAAGPTGLMLIDMRVFEVLPRPWFAYEWKDSTQREKASTEDVVFTRNLSMLGIDQIVNWNAWAAHYKVKRVRKPGLITIESIAERMREPLLASRRAGEATIVMDGSNLPNIVAACNGNGALAKEAESAENALHNATNAAWTQWDKYAAKKEEAGLSLRPSEAVAGEEGRADQQAAQ